MSFLDLPHEVNTLILNFLPSSSHYICLTYFNKIFVPIKKTYYHIGSIIGDSIKYDNIELFKLLLNNNLNYFNDVVRCAAYFGSMNILKYIIETLPKKNGYFKSIQLDEKIFNAACEGGHIDVLTYLKEIGLFNTKVIVLKNNIFDVVEWLKNNNFPLENISHSSNNIKLLKCLHKNGVEFDKKIAFYTNNFKVLKWLHSIGYKITSHTFIGELNLNVIKWLYNNGYELTSSCYCNVANNKEMLEWLLSIDCPKIGVVNTIIKTGNLELLKWAKDNNFLFDQDVCNTAVRNNKFEILKWLNSTGFTFDQNIIAYAIAENCNIELIEWLLSFGLQLNSEHYYTASYYNRYDILKYLKEKNISLPQGKLNVPPNIKIVEFLVENGFKLTEVLLYDACLIGNIRFIKWYLNSGYRYNKCTFEMNLLSRKSEMERLINKSTFPDRKLYLEHIEINKFLKDLKNEIL